MRYWFFDGSDVLGPFVPKELERNKSFSATSLICPENFSNDGEHWQPAVSFVDFKHLFARLEDELADETVTLEQEMDGLLKQSSPLAFDKTTTDGPSLKLPQKPAAPGPIEDYFNNIKEEDLGDILGIPDPNDDSDMDLAHALEKQLAKTSSTRREEREAEQAAVAQAKEEQKELARAQETHHVATATEVFSPAPTTQSAPNATPSMPTVEEPTLPVLAQDPAVSPLQPPLQTDETTQHTAPLPLQATQQTATTKGDPVPEVQELVSASTATKGASAPDAQAPAPQTSAEPTIIPDPAALRHEKVEVNSINARLKQTQEMKDFLNQTQHDRLKKLNVTHHAHATKIALLFMALVVILGGLFVLREAHTLRAPAVPARTTAQELLSPTTPAATLSPSNAPVPTAVRPEKNNQQRALEIVQNHLLSGSRGTLQSYLTRIYQNQFAQGYTATWEAEPLYKDTYIVKYRLTKTRKEPIIYVFQANVALGKVTGALNNISLDLVGKLPS